MKRSLLAYLVALGAVAAALAGRWLLDPLLGDHVPFTAFFAAVVVAAWFGGLRAGLLASVLSLVVARYFFIPPRFGFSGTSGPDLLGMGLFLAVSCAISAIGEAVRRVQRRSDRAERAAQQKEGLLRLTLASIGDAVITTDNDGHVTYMNAVAETVTGWKSEEAAGRPVESVFRVVDEQTGAAVESPVRRATRLGAAVGLTRHSVLVGKDGSKHPVDDTAAPIQDERGRVSGVVLIFRDVTEQRHTERQNAEHLVEARLLASIVESSEDAIVSKSLDGIIQSWNSGAQRLFGYPREQAVGHPISLIIPPDRRVEEDGILARLRAGERVDHFETVRVRSDGRRIQVSLTVSPIRDEAGRIIGASKIARDISRQKEVEERISRLMSELEGAHRRKDEFLATLAHELRGPLAPLRNMLEILKRAGGDAGLSRQAREGMERQLGLLVRLVDDLLDVSRITQNKLELRRERVDLASILHQAVESCRPLAESARHELSVSLPSAPVLLYGDAVRLVQVFANLLNNACKYTGEGGRIRMGAEVQDGQVVVTVKDNGIGIPPHMLDRVFEMFAQVERQHEQWPPGLGIGLSLVKQLVGMHGGSVRAFSEGAGRGSEFVVRLPVLAGEFPELGPPSALAAPPAPPRRVLVVDDNLDSANSLAMLLEMTGNETRTANDGIEAIEVAQRFRPDLVLLDIGLPRSNGHDVCRRIRAASWGKDMVLVAVTGWGQEEDRRRSREAGFDHHLVKPVEFSQLMKLLAEAEPRPPASETSGLRGSPRPGEGEDR